MKEPLPIRVLVVEDQEDDYLLLLRRLKEDGLRVSAQRVETEKGFTDFLREDTWDLIICDYSLPGYSSAAVLAEVRRRKLDIPVIIVSGAVGEETAVAAMREGARDFLTKDHLHRLCPAVQRELHEAEIRKERRRAIVRLKESEKRFEIAVRGSSDGLWDWPDLGISVQWWSPQCFKLLGYELHDLTPSSRAFFKLLHPADRKSAFEAFQAHLQGRTPFDLEVRVQTKAGEYKWFRTRGEALFDSRNVPIRMAGLIQNIDERRQAEEALKEYSERLEEMVQERTAALRQAQEELIRKEKLATLGQLAGGIGHELRNPLGTIKNSAYFLKMVLSDNSDPEVLETLDLMESEVEASVRIISSLLDFARSRPPVRVKTQINDLLELNVTRLNSRSAKPILTSLSPDLPPVLADPAQLSQVFENLILNALQSIEADGEVCLSSIFLPPDRVKIEVRDTGVGIPEPVVQKVFEPLFTTKPRGIGLGLALSRSLVEGHGGTISVESKEGEGSIFSVTLPVAPESSLR